MNSSKKESHTTRIVSTGKLDAIEELKVKFPDMSKPDSDLSQANGEKDDKLAEEYDPDANSGLNRTGPRVALSLPPVAHCIASQPMPNTGVISTGTELLQPCGAIEN